MPPRPPASDGTAGHQRGKKPVALHDNRLRNCSNPELSRLLTVPTDIPSVLAISLSREPARIVQRDDRTRRRRELGHGVLNDPALLAAFGEHRRVLVPPCSVLLGPRRLKAR